MSPASPSPIRRLLWCAVVFAILIVPLWPAIELVIIERRADALGCLVDHAAACVRDGKALGPRLEIVLDAALAIGRVLSLTIPLWLLICYLALRRIIPSMRARLVVAGLLTLFLAWAPYMAPIQAFLRFQHDGCQPIGFLTAWDCQLLGVDVGQSVSNLFNLTLLFVYSIGLGLLTYVIYLARQIARHRREQKAAMGGLGTNP
jgi:hypothetical protein